MSDDQLLAGCNLIACFYNDMFEVWQEPVNFALHGPSHAFAPGSFSRSIRSSAYHCKLLCADDQNLQGVLEQYEYDLRFGAWTGLLISNVGSGSCRKTQG